MKGIKMSRNVGKNIFVYLILLYPALQFSVMYLGTNFTTILMAFQTVKGGKTVFAGLSNFAEVIRRISEDALFKTATINSVKMAVICFVISNPLYIIFAYYIYKKRFLSKTLRFTMLLPNIVSHMIVILVFKRVLEDVLPSVFGGDFPNLLTDERYAFGTQVFFNIWISFASNVIIMPNAMNAIPPEITESARLDGVNMWREIWHIILPHIYPTLTTFIVTNVASMFASSYSLVTFFYYDKCPESAYTMGYYLVCTVMKNQNSKLQLCFAAALGLLLTSITAPMTLTVKHALEKYGPSEETKKERKKK